MVRVDVERLWAAVDGRGPWGALWHTHQLPLLGGQGGGRQGLVHRVGAAEGVVEAVHFLEALVALLVDALALWCLVEHGGLGLRVVLHVLHVLRDWGTQGTVSAGSQTHSTVSTHSTAQHRRHTKTHSPDSTGPQTHSTVITLKHTAQSAQAHKNT